jgi:two-component system sensor histidine kinase KdpD
MRKEKYWSNIKEYLVVVLVVVAATGLFVPLRSYFAKGQWALIYLLIVVIIGNVSGFRAALLASVLAFFSWNYFLIPPYHTFAVDDPKDLLSLLVFLVVGVIIGYQTGKLRELAQVKALHEADKLKSTLISSVSHELKTPLSAINATVTNLLAGEMNWDEKYARSELETVAEDVKRLNSSINALLDFSRLETESWRPRKEQYELSEIIGALADQLPRQDRERLEVEIPPDLPPLWVDFEQFLRLLLILVENGLRYSERQTRVAIKAKEELLGEILIMVEDRGPGIPDEEKRKVFERFYRGRSSARAPVGTGLGLAIAAEIVKHHEGKIWIEDAVPHGTRMVVSIPAGEIK